jgi:hypothetical protein
VSLAPSATAIAVNGILSALPLVADPGASSQTVGTIGTRPVVVGPSSEVIVGTATLRPGHLAVTIDGSIVSVASEATAIVVGSKTTGLPRVIFPAESVPTQAPAPPVLTIGSSTLTANAATQFFISPGQTLTPGGSATVDGTVVSLGPLASFVVVGGQTQILPIASSVAVARPEVVVGGATITAIARNSDNQRGNNPAGLGDGTSGPTFVISGQTLAPSHEITVDGTTISLAPAGSFIVVNGVRSTLSTPAVAQPTAPSIRIGSSVYTPLSGTGTSYMVGTTLLTPGGQVTVAGSTISLAPSGSFVVVNGVTSAFYAATQGTGAFITIGTNVYTPLSGEESSYLIGTALLTRGGAITVSSSTISLDTDGSRIIVNGVTSTLHGQPFARITNPPLLTIGSQTYTAALEAGTTFIIRDQTLTPGGTITVDGTTIVLSPGATELIYGNAGKSTTTALFPATTTRGPFTTTRSESAPSAGATDNSQPTATSSTADAGFRFPVPGPKNWFLSLTVGAFGLLM